MNETPAQAQIPAPDYNANTAILSDQFQSYIVEYASNKIYIEYAHNILNTVNVMKLVGLRLNSFELVYVKILILEEVLNPTLHYGPKSLDERQDMFPVGNCV